MSNTKSSSGINLMNSNSFRLRFAKKFLRSLSKIKPRKPLINNISQQQSANSEFRRRSHRIKMAAYSSMARAVGPQKAWSRALLFKLRTRARFHSLMRKRCLISSTKKKRKDTRTRSLAATVAVTAEPSSRNQMEKLRGLVPGGEGMDILTLLEETAHYVHCLKTQVKVMKSISQSHQY